MDYEALIQAVVTHYNASSMAGQVTIHPQGVNQEIARPYASWLCVSNPAEQTTSSFDDHPLIQLSAWSAAEMPNEAAHLGGVLTQVFDNASFTVEGARLVSCVREADRLIADPDGGWQFSADYRFNIERQKGV
jgi:hypothetical protein